MKFLLFLKSQPQHFCTFSNFENQSDMFIKTPTNINIQRELSEIALNQIEKPHGICKENQKREAFPIQPKKKKNSQTVDIFPLQKPKKDQLHSIYTEAKNVITTIFGSTDMNN